MQTETFAKSIRTIHDGMVNLPGEVQRALGVSEGSKIIFIVDGEDVRVANPLMYAMSKFQKAMEGAAEEAGWKSDDDVVEYIMEMRRGRK